MLTVEVAIKASRLLLRINSRARSVLKSIYLPIGGVTVTLLEFNNDQNKDRY